MTTQEMVAVVRGLASREVDPAAVDWAALTDRQYRELWPLVNYQISYLHKNRASKAQIKAMKLLRSLLADEERAELNRSGAITLHLRHTYRLAPKVGNTWLLERHGKRWFNVARFCLHESTDDDLPPADRTVTHLLMLRADELGFLNQANVWPCRPQWGATRQMRAERLERAALRAQLQRPFLEMAS